MKARLELIDDGAVARVVLAAPKANVLDRAMIGELDAMFESLESRDDLHAIVVTSDGPNFSFGASVQEHLPHEIEGTLARLGALLRRVASAPAPTIAAVRGQCLGGAFELVLACDLIIAEESAQFGLPEIKLGVFPPAASVLLPLRVGLARASSMILTGSTWSGRQACDYGLVDCVAATGDLPTLTDSFLDEFMLHRSGVALRYATYALRASVVRQLRDELPRVDRLYLDELMTERDAVEGINAFLEKREPHWTQKRVTV